jgi:hypothetical protein
MSQYSTGTATVTNGSPTVTGTNTLWLANVSAGDSFTVAGDGVMYDVASVDSDTQITLSVNYAGVTAAGVVYTIARDFTSPDNFPELTTGDIETPTIITRAMRKIQGKITGIEDRVIRVTSIAAMEAYSAPVGYVFSLNAGGRSGTFDVIAGDFSAELAADTLNGVYIGQADDPTATTKVAFRRGALTSSNGVNVSWFGVDPDSGNDESVGVQAAFDLAATALVRGTTVEFPAGTFKCNIVENGAYDVRIIGAGLTNTIIQSFTQNEFALSIDQTFRSVFINDLRIDGNGQDFGHGLYVNNGSEVRLTNVEIQQCGLGYVCNSTINTTYNQCVFRDNYVSTYFTTRRSVDGNLDVTDVNGQTVTLTDAFFPSHPSVAHFNGCLFKSCVIAFCADDGTNPYQNDMAYSFYDCNIEANKIGWVYESGFSALAQTRYAYHLSCWMEGNGSATDVVFNGVTYPPVECTQVRQKSGSSIFENMKFETINLSGTATMELKSCGFKTENSTAITSDKSSIFADNLHGENSSITNANMIAHSVLTNSTRATLYNTRIFRQVAPNDYVTYSQQDFAADGSSVYASTTVVTDVVDGVFATKECKEMECTLHGPYISSAERIEGQYLVSIFNLKWVSGETLWRIKGINANSPAGSASRITLNEKWQSYAFVNKMDTSTGYFGSNFLKPANGTSSTLRISGRCSLVFDTLSEVRAFFDAGNFAVAR